VSTAGAAPEVTIVGLLDFMDKDGVRWRVWRVDTPAAPAYLMDTIYRDGWLVFEREDGKERRRLARIPDDWTSLASEHLAQLCQAATPVRLSPTGSQSAIPRPGAQPKQRDSG
jgi:hypothetical protein